jgi:hypothetical protein
MSETGSIIIDRTRCLVHRAHRHIGMCIFCIKSVHFVASLFGTKFFIFILSSCLRHTYMFIIYYY